MRKINLSFEKQDNINAPKKVGVARPKEVVAFGWYLVFGRVVVSLHIPPYMYMQLFGLVWSEKMQTPTSTYKYETKHYLIRVKKKVRNWNFSRGTM